MNTNTEATLDSASNNEANANKETVSINEPNISIFFLPNFSITNTVNILPTIYIVPNKLVNITILVTSSLSYYYLIPFA